MADKGKKARDDQEPADFQRDLNPDGWAGRNYGLQGPPPEKSGPTAFDLKEIRQAQPGLTDDELRRLPVLPEGTRLEQGAVYFDLRHPGRGEIKATANMVATTDNWYIPKSEVDYPLWNRMIGVRNPERLDYASE